MAASSAAARQELFAMVALEPWLVAGTTPRAARGAIAFASGDAERAGSRRRAGGADGRAANHRLSARLSRRTLRHELASTRPLSDTRQSRRVAGADLSAPRPAG